MGSTLAQIMAESLDMTATEEYCVNCLEVVIVPDDRTGPIHKHGKYRCFTYTDNGKAIPMSTVAERN